VFGRLPESQPGDRGDRLKLPVQQGDLPRIKKVFRKRAFVYLGNFPVDPAEAIEAYRAIMELMTPDVIVVPHLTVPMKADPGEVYRRMRAIADEYAKRMDWGWEGAA
jgi:hypothetical protein